MNLAAKQFDIVIGVDIHIVQPPGPVPPLPVPHPFIGIVFDPMDFIPLLGATIMVNGMPRAQAGTAAKDIPVHFPLGGMFIKPPGNQGEMFMGSATVIAEGEPFTHMAHPVLSCHDIGMLGPPRMKKKGAKTMMLPTSVVLPIPMGQPVLIGGPPTISLMGMAMKSGLAALGKGLQKFNKLKKGSKRMKALSDKIHAAINKTGLSQKWKDRLHSAVCTVTGHPVNVADGSVLTSIVDFEFSGPIPFRWERHWFSNGIYHGPLGQGWFHHYDRALEVQHDGMVVARLAEGRLVAFPIPEAGNSYFHRKEKIILFNDGTSLYLRDQDLLTYRFKQEGVPIDASTIHYLESIEDPNGFAIRFEYSRANSLSRIIDSAGREFLFTTDDQGRITQIEAPHPDQVGETFVLQTYAYDEKGNLAEARDALGQPFRYEYLGHLLTRETNRNGLSFYFAYDGIDELAKCHHTWGDGGIYDHKLQYFNSHTVVENSLGHRTTYYHEGGLVWKTIDPNGGVTLTNYNEFNELVSEKNPLGFGPSYGYDDRGNQVLVIGPEGATAQSEFNALNLPVKTVEAVGGVWQWQYDNKGNLVQKTDPLGDTIWLHYDNGLLTEIIDPAGERTVLSYDKHHNLKMLVMPNEQFYWWGYDMLGRCNEFTDAKGNTQHKKYDLLGRLVEVREPDGNIYQLRYDREGNVTLAQDLQNRVGFEYAGMNRMKARTEGENRVEFRYDTEEQLIGVVNEQGSVYRFVFDANGEIVAEQGFDGIQFSYVRDAAGRAIEVLRPGNLKTFNTYDPAGRLLQVRYSDGAEVCYAYREDGELIEARNENAVVRLERDLLGRVIREKQGEVTVDSGYNYLGLRTSVRSSLGADICLFRNALGDISQIKAGNWQVHFRRNALGLELEREFSGGLRSRWSRDQLGRPVKHETFTGGDSLHRTQTYNWGVNERLQQVTDSLGGLTHFGHDLFGRLAWSENFGGSRLYRMPDAVGNLFRTKERSDRKYGPAGRLLQAGGCRYEYDPEGNLIRKTLVNGKEWQYHWNAAGMLSRVIRPDGKTVDFQYDALGRRIAKRYCGKVTQWVWDEDQPLHEWTTLELEDNNVDNVITWLFEEESLAPLAKLVGEQQYNIVTDHLGTPLEMFSSEGKKVWGLDLDIYGYPSRLEGRLVECPFRYQGQYEDEETGLYYNRFRYYDPTVGIYISQDPIGLLGDKNFYAYVEDPLIWIDELGLRRGGSYGGIRPTNRGGEVNHIPAKSVSPLSRNEGPAIWMTKRDHRKTASWGSSHDAQAYRQKQKAWLHQKPPRWDKAMEMDIMDIKDIKKKFNNKYDNSIKEMLDHAKQKGLINNAQYKRLKGNCK